MNLGPGQIQSLRNHRHGFAGYVAESFLNLMKDGEQRAGAVLVLADGRVDRFADIGSRN